MAGEARPGGPPLDRLFAYGGGVTNKGDWYVQKPDDPIQLFFEDLVFCERYVQALERLSSGDYFDQLYADLDDGDNLTRFFGVMTHFNNNKEIDTDLKRKIENHFSYKWNNDKNQGIDEDMIA